MTDLEVSGAGTPEVDPLASVAPVPNGAGAHRAGAVHAHLRELILNGGLSPGTVLNQVELAPRLGVSRTPLREALRMLQEEGLVEAQPQRRARVASFRPAEIESLYVQRIMVEGLAVTLTTPQLTSEDIEQLDHLVAEMHGMIARLEIRAWRVANREFHLRLVSGVSHEILRTIETNMDKTDRYRRLFDSEPLLAFGEAEHTAIVDAVRRRDGLAAAAELAHHLARTTIALIAHFAPDYEPAAIRGTLAIHRARANGPRARPGA